MSLGNIVAPGTMNSADANQIMMMNAPNTIPKEDYALYVGNLNSDIDDQVLHEYFLPYGEIASVSVKKHYITNISRGFGFVNYHSTESARRAKEALNHSIIRGREIRICFKKDFKNLDPEANLYIKNIPEKITSKVVDEEFIVHGPIFSCAVKYDENAKHLGYGYVQFLEKESAEKALEVMHNKIYFDQPITVQKFIPRGKRNVKSWKTNLYVKGFPESWNLQQVEDFIKQKFGAMGKITSNVVNFNSKIGRHFAFVAFETEEEANEALKSFSEFEVEKDNLLYVGYAQKKVYRKKTLAENFAKQANETNLFIKSLKEETTEDNIKAVFGRYGEITSIALRLSDKVPKSIEKYNVKLKFGFVNFKNENDAKTAFVECKKDASLKSLVSQYHDERKDFLYFAQPKNVREQYLTMTRKNLMSTSLLNSQNLMMRNLMAQWTNTNKRNQFQKRGKGSSSKPQMDSSMMNPMFMFQQMGMDPSILMNQMMNQFQMNSMAQMNPMGMINPMAQMNPMAMMNPNFGVVAPQRSPAINTVQQMQVVAGPNDIQKPSPQSALDSKDISWLINNQREFENMDSVEKRKLLGNLMYYRVDKMKVDRELVPKITGMLIDLEVLDLSDIIDILQSDETLLERINDAIAIINEADN